MEDTVTVLHEPQELQEPEPVLFDAARAARLVEGMERDLRDLRRLLSGVQAPVPHGPELHGPVGFMAPHHEEEAGVEGTFDGEKMIGADGRIYPVPPNYASKSKLVEGDPLKLYVSREGKHLFKQMGPVERRTVPGTLRQEGARYVVDTDDEKTYGVLTACVTYYVSLNGLKPGDRVTALLPETGEPTWCVIENLL